MTSVAYPTRCIKHFFGYCSRGIQGEETTNPDKSVTFVGTTGNCQNDWSECQHYVSNTVANPYRAELADSKLVTKVEPVKEKPKKEKKATKSV